MIDIHSHILPGMDDGAADEKTAIKMAKIAVKDGTTAIIATPHCQDGVHDCRKQDILLTCQQFNRLLREQGVPLTVYPGAEIRLTPELMDMFKRGELLTLNNAGRHILLELPLRFIAEAVVRVIHQLKEQGVQAIIAHPERNTTIQSRPEIITELTFAGAGMQITAESLQGKLGRPTARLAEKMVCAGNVYCLATDCHGVRKRSPRLAKAYKKLQALVGRESAEEIVQNPELILQNDHTVAAGCSG